MKAVLLVLGILGFQFVHAQHVPDRESAKVISDYTYDLAIDLNDKTVQCLIGDYGASSLKVVIPDLKELTNLDHTSRGAAGPCVTAGFCNQMHVFPPTDTRLSSLITPSKPSENIKLRVVMSEVFFADIQGKRCGHFYREEVSTIIRGIPFNHVREIALAKVELADCM